MKLRCVIAVHALFLVTLFAFLLGKLLGFDTTSSWLIILPLAVTTMPGIILARKAALIRSGLSLALAVTLFIILAAKANQIDGDEGFMLSGIAFAVAAPVALTSLVIWTVRYFTGQRHMVEPQA